MINPEQIITIRNNVGKNPIIACIGSTKIISDSLGPIVGQLLIDKYRVKATVIGTLISPLHALNLVDRIREATLSRPFGKIIAVDAYENSENRDNIRIIDGGIKPGLASGKNLPRIGDYSIVGSVCRYGGNVCCLGKVFTLADKIAKLIDLIVNSFPEDKDADPEKPISNDTFLLSTL